MSKKSNSKSFIVFGIVIIALVAVGMVTNIIPISLFLTVDPSTYANLSKLSFVTGSRTLDCDAFNRIVVDGRVVANGREGLTPNILTSVITDVSTLDLVDAGRSVSKVSVELWLVCSGNVVKDADRTGAGSVSGSLNTLLCAGSSPEICFASNSRSFDTVDGVAISTTQFHTVPLVCDPSFSACAGSSFLIEDDKEVLLSRVNFSDEFLERTFPAPKQVTIVSKMYPNLTFTFVTVETDYTKNPVIETETTTRASYNSLAENDLVYGQYNGLSNTIPDTDGDGFLDNVDGCINQPETFNNYQDDDGCPDSIPIDTDGDGIPDDVDQCSTEPETYNDFQDSDGCPDLVCADGEIFNPILNECQEDAIACTAHVDPVCGSDGSTYSNSCHADIVGVDYTLGACEDDPEPDDDGDRIPNSDDICPSTPANQSVDSDGCSLGQLNLGQTDDCVEPLFSELGICTSSTGYDGDYDNDGVLDIFDNCIDTAPNLPVGQFGCESFLPPFEDDNGDSEIFIIDCIEGFVPNPDGSQSCIAEVLVDVPEEGFETTTTTVRPNQANEDRTFFLIILVVVGIVAVVVLSATGKIKL